MKIHSGKNPHSPDIAASKNTAKPIKTKWYTKTVRVLQLAEKGEVTQKMYARSVRQLIECNRSFPPEMAPAQNRGG